jgi:AcrR family transcriptional regulator
MSRPKNADGQRTREAILEAALRLFADKGYFGTSLRDVASAVGVRESALYNYFKSKEALFEALILAHRQDKDERLAEFAAAPIADGRALLERLTMASLESFVTPREERLFRLLMSDGIRLARTGRINLYERLGSGRERLQEIMRRLMRDGFLRTADPQLTAIHFFAPLMVWRQMHAAGVDVPMIRDRAAFARQHVDQFLQGAALAPTPRRSTAGARPIARIAKVSRRRAGARRQSS